MKVSARRDRDVSLGDGGLAHAREARLAFSFRCMAAISAKFAINIKLLKCISV